MNLNDAKKLFFANRNSCKILVRPHAYKDHPNRAFSSNEILNLIKLNGTLKDNKAPSAIINSFVFHTKDDFDVECQLVVLFDSCEENLTIIIVASAWRKEKL